MCSKAEQDMWAGTASVDKDPRRSLHVGDGADPGARADEAYIAVMASSINFNTVWTHHLRTGQHVRSARPVGT